MVGVSSLQLIYWVQLNGLRIRSDTWPRQNMDSHELSGQLLGVEDTSGTFVVDGGASVDGDGVGCASFGHWYTERGTQNDTSG